MGVGVPPSPVGFGVTKDETKGDSGALEGKIKYNRRIEMKMRIKRLIMIISLFGAGWLLSACGVERSGLEVVSNPIAKVYLDGKEIGRSPYKSNNLKPGAIIVKILTDEGKVWEREIRLEKNVSTVINWNFEGDDSDSGYILSMERTGEASGILINTQPQRASINIGGEIKGYSPAKIEELGEGDKEVTIAYPGYKNLHLIVKMVKGYQLVVDAKMASEIVNNSVVIPETSPSATLQVGPKIRIKETGTGWLRVREEANNSAPEIGKVKPGEIYEYMSSDTEWYLIKYLNETGWVSAKYVEKISE